MFGNGANWDLSTVIQGPMGNGRGQNKKGTVTVNETLHQVFAEVHLYRNQGRELRPWSSHPRPLTFVDVTVFKSTLSERLRVNPRTCVWCRSGMSKKKKNRVGRR